VSHLTHQILENKLFGFACFELTGRELDFLPSSQPTAQLRSQVLARESPTARIYHLGSGNQFLID
jgi:hypothetical protein